MKIPNPLHENIIGFPLGYELPKEFGLHQYVDYELQFQKSFMAPLDTIFKVIDWKFEKKTKSIELF